jgi:hypothetical protein
MCVSRTFRHSGQALQQFGVLGVARLSKNKVPKWPLIIGEQEFGLCLPMQP